jgi:ribose transport system permease protein
MLAFARGLANQISDGASVSGFPESFRFFGGGEWGPVPATVGIAAVVLAAAAITLYLSRFGLHLYGVGGSRDASALSGIRVRRVEFLAYTMCGLLAGVGGLMLASRVSVGQASLGTGFELMSIATAVIGGVAIGGGLGRLSGVVLGVVLLSVLSTGMNIAQVSEFIQQMVTGAVLVAAVLIDRLRLRRAESNRLGAMLD